MRLPGSGSFPEAASPPAFDGDTGRDILWKAPLPNWSNSSPIAVDTKECPRVVLLAERWEGKWIAARRGPVNVGYYGGGRILSGASFLSWNLYGGVKSSDKTTPPERAQFVWVDPETGKKLGEGFLPVNPADGRPLAFRREQAGRDSWRWLGAASPSASRNRFYIRAHDLL